MTEDGASAGNVGFDLTISAQDVLDFTDAGNEFYVVGTAGDTVTLDAGWALGAPESVTGTDFAVYTHAGLGVTVNVDDGINVIVT